jgi:3-dehydroquinate dehydratase type I
MKPKICVSVKARTINELEWKAKRALDIGGDLVELRIDYLENPSMEKLTKLVLDLSNRIIVTVRPQWEGGEFRGEEELRVKLLKELVRLKPAYIDLELKTVQDSMLKFDRESARIISWHILDNTPSLDELSLITSEMLKLGDIAKIVTKVNGFEENLRILRLYKIYPPEKLIVFGLGERGLLSRILSILMGSPIIYACLPGEEVAPGQPTVGEIIEIITMLESRGIWR